MQNPNLSNAGHLGTRSQASLLDARSLSPSIHMMHNFHDVYPADMPTQQFYHSMPHNTSMSNVHDHIPPHNRTMSSVVNRTFAPAVNPHMQLPSSTGPNHLTRNHPVNEFTEQYNRLQQARMEQQLKTHTEAMARKQQTFTMRQILNPPPMSRQVSAINIHQQVNTSTQTTPNAQLPQSLQGQSTTLNNAFGVDHFHQHHNTDSPKHFNHIEKPNHLQLQHEHQKLIQSLRHDFEIKSQQQKQSQNLNLNRASTNPFITSDIDSDARVDSGAQSPVHQALVYRDHPSSSSATSTPTKLLKSPKTKRQPTSLVTFSGWLYKLSSEGLRTWRRRWFVLSDYCLFYYKGPEEDKLLGSILLPSYILSECLPSESKAYRKFAFKLEHKNMRTYYLASENGDYMRKWMRVIRAATLMQTLCESQNKQIFSNTTPGINSYDFGVSTNRYDGYRNEQNQRKVDIHPSLNPVLIFDEDNERQPLYVNAPPKPRRTHNELELSMFGNDPTMFPLSSEASTESTPKGLPLRMLEYEDIYNEHGRHPRTNPVKSAETSAQPTIADIQSYGLENVSAPYNNEFTHSLAKKPFQQKKMPPRPRSADFLEYESKRHFRRCKDFDGSGHFNERLPSRPKSSLDINSAMDYYYYSEASYAAKMRQSAQYLHNRNLIGRNDTRLNTLRYEKDRKRLTNEFNNYTANLILNNGLTLPRSKYTPNNESYQLSSLMRSSEPADPSLGQENRYLLKNSENNLTEHYRSNDMISGKASSMSIRDDLQNGNANIWQPSISAGTLLSKTHEELVLLLIQLRRQVDMKERGITRRLKDMQTIQRRLKSEEATATRLELMGRLEVLREEVNKMEQQYEKTKPLMNLVDNMVKLGSLYRAGSMQWDTTSISTGMNLQRLRVNQKELERRLQLDDQKQWNKLDPNQIELQNKVQQLYELDQRLQEESNNMQMLQQDKDEIEGALEELNQQFTTTEMLPDTYMTRKKIQHSLELELSKVHNQMAENARCLEATVAGNTKLERELLVLRQKLQATRDQSGHMNYMSVMNSSRTADAFESELRKVRDSVGDTQRQREELSMAVNQLTLDSNVTHDRLRTTSTSDILMKMNANKRTDCEWTETEIDSMHKKNSRNANGYLSGSTTFEPTYRNEKEPYYYQYQQNADDLNSDEHWLGNDKQEIRTVRIVKRESERRHKDKLNQNYDNTNAMSTEHNNPDQQLNEFLSTYQTPEPRTSNFYDDEPSASKAKLTIRNASHSTANTNSTVRNDNMFQSNTTVTKPEQTSNKSANSTGSASNNQSSNQYKRFTPRKKKRHNTAPTSENFMDYMAERDSYKYNNHRARDDLDMEVVLRSNPSVENTISGPPDVIRSALGQNNEYLFDKMN